MSILGILVFLICLTWNVTDSGMAVSRNNMLYSRKTRSSSDDEQKLVHQCGATDLRIEEIDNEDGEVKFTWRGFKGVEFQLECDTDNSTFTFYTPYNCSGFEKLKKQKMKKKFNIPDINYYCAVVAYDYPYTRTSNIITVSIVRVPTTVTINESNNSWPTKPSSRYYVPDIIIVISVIIGALIILAIITVIIVCRTKKRRENPPFSGIILRDNPPLSEHDYPSVSGQQSSNTEKFDQPPPYPFEELHPQSFTQQNYDKNQNPIPAHWGNPPPYSVQSDNRAFTPNAPPMQE